MASNVADILAATEAEHGHRRQEKPPFDDHLIACEPCALEHAPDPTRVPYTAVCQSLAECDICGHRIGQMAGMVVGENADHYADGHADLTWEPDPDVAYDFSGF